MEEAKILAVVVMEVAKKAMTSPMLKRLCVPFAVQGDNKILEEKRILTQEELKEVLATCSSTCGRRSTVLL